MQYGSAFSASMLCPPVFAVACLFLKKIVQTRLKALDLVALFFGVES